MEPNPDKEYESVIPIHGYTVLKPGSSQVSIGLQNHSCHKVRIPAKSIIAKVTAANVVAHSLALNLGNETMLNNLRNAGTNYKPKRMSVNLQIRKSQN